MNETEDRVFFQRYLQKNGKKAISIGFKKVEKIKNTIQSLWKFNQYYFLSLRDNN